MRTRRSTMRQIILVSLFLFAATVAAAQPAEPVPTPLPLTREQRMRAIQIRTEITRAYYDQFTALTLADYSTAYLVGPALLEDSASLVSPEAVIGHIPTILVFVSGDKLPPDNDESGRRFDAVIIHRSALAWLDTAWVQESYGNGMSITTIGMTFDEHRLVTGDRCNLPAGGDPIQNSPNREPGRSSVSSITSKYVLRTDGLSAEQVAQFIEADLQTCKSASDRLEGATLSGYVIHDLRSDDDLRLLRAVISNETKTADAFRGLGVIYEEISRQLAAEGLGN